MGGTLKIQPQGINGVYTKKIGDFEVMFEIEDKKYTAKPIQSHGYYMTFDTTVYEFKINNPYAMLYITIQEHKNGEIETTTNEISLLSDEYKKNLERNETFYFVFPDTERFHEKNLSVNIEFISSAISLLNREINDFYKVFISSSPEESKKRFLVL